MKLLDTDICIHLLNAREPELIERLAAREPPNIALCSIVRAELLWGARNSQRIDENLARVRAFAAPFQSLSFDDTSAEHYSLIRASLAAQGQPIGPNDTLIAAIARAHEAILVTRNLRKFSRVSGLELETWQGRPVPHPPTSSRRCGSASLLAIAGCGEPAPLVWSGWPTEGGAAAAQGWRERSLDTSVSGGAGLGVDCNHYRTDGSALPEQPLVAPLVEADDQRAAHLHHGCAQVAGWAQHGSRGRLRVGIAELDLLDFASLGHDQFIGVGEQRERGVEAEFAAGRDLLCDVDVPGPQDLGGSAASRSTVAVIVQISDFRHPGRPPADLLGRCTLSENQQVSGTRPSSGPGGMG